MTGTITYDNVLSLLSEAIPEFHRDRDDVSENLVYLVFPELMRFVKRELDGKQNQQLLERIFAYLEQASQCRDPRVTEMLRDALHDLAIADPDKPRAFMGPTRADCSGRSRRKFTSNE